MAKKSSKLAKDLAPREEQIMNAVYQLGKATVAQVREHLTDPPSYSAVRTMLGQLERKGHVRRDRSDMTHTYSPVKPRKKAGLSAMQRLLDTFFPQSAGDALAALIDDSANKLSEEELTQLEQAIQRARQGGR